MFYFSGIKTIINDHFERDGEISAKEPKMIDKFFRRSNMSKPGGQAGGQGGSGQGGLSATSYNKLVEDLRQGKIRYH